MSENSLQSGPSMTSSCPSTKMRPASYLDVFPSRAPELQQPQQKLESRVSTPYQPTRQVAPERGSN